MFVDFDDYDYGGCFDNEDDDNPRGHSETCTCEHCVQNYPERICCDDDEYRIVCPKCNCAILEDEFVTTEGMCIYCLNELDGW